MRIELADDRPRVEIELSDGSMAVLSPLVAEDRDYLVRGLEELSVESRFARFGQGRHSLSETEWQYLTNIDQRDHVAWVAMIDGEGAGVGRYIRGEECAEVALTVLDPYQQRGLGKALLYALIAVARADGIPSFCVEVVPSNLRVREIVENLAEDLADVEGLLEGRIRLGAEIVIPNQEEILAVMAAVRQAQ